MQRSRAAIGTILLLTVVFVVQAREKQTEKLISASFKALPVERRQSIVQYLSDKVVILPDGFVVQHSIPKYGFHGGSATRTGGLFGGSIGWYTRNNYSELAKRGVYRIDSIISQSAGGDLYLIDNGNKAVVASGQRHWSMENYSVAGPMETEFTNIEPLQGLIDA